MRTQTKILQMEVGVHDFNVHWTDVEAPMSPSAGGSGDEVQSSSMLVRPRVLPL